jgi:hypothetical protein
MARGELYQIHKHVAKDGKVSFVAQKFDMDFTPKSSYAISAIPGRENTLQLECTCFASNKPTCRHRAMVEIFTNLNRLNGGWYYDFDRNKWHNPAAGIDFENM